MPPARDDPNPPRVQPGRCGVDAATAAVAVPRRRASTLPSPPKSPSTTHSGLYKNVGDMVVSVVRKEGPKALFGGLGPSLVGARQSVASGRSHRPAPLHCRFGRDVACGAPLTLGDSHGVQPQESSLSPERSSSCMTA